jgi:hypothetical protein
MPRLTRLRAWARRVAAALGAAVGPVGPPPVAWVDEAGPAPVAISAEAQLVAATVDHGRVVLDCLSPAGDGPQAFTIFAAPLGPVRRRELRAIVRAWLDSDGWVSVVLLDEDRHRRVYVDDGTEGRVLALARAATG